MQPILEIKNISKKFRIQHEQQPYLSLRDSLVSMFKSSTLTSEEFYALKDVSFDVYPGESIGIIGKNGAGKSTLLKILSKITPPTSGKIISHGRIASLLEVGTGFHPELSGRENIFLNGSILGMKRKEIQSKFDEIVDFSGVEQFLDTPLKHYSSGMQLRLAFAVAAFLEPEILIIDEVLAVGDAEFQKKCMGKMEDVSKSGRTVLFVSHNMSAVKKICTKTVLLSEGNLKLFTDTENAINFYLQNINTLEKPIVSGNRLLKLLNFEIVNFDAQKITSFNTFDNVTFKIQYQALEDLKQVSFAVCFNNSNNQRITSLWSSYYNKKFDVKKGVFFMFFQVPSIKLIPDNYEIILFAESNGYTIERIDNFMNIIVGYTNKFGFAETPSICQGLFIEDYECKIKLN